MLQVFNFVRLGFLGDSRVRNVVHYAPEYATICYHECIPGCTTAQWRSRGNFAIPNNLEFVMIFLMQCDLTIRTRTRVIIPNWTVHLPELLENVRIIQQRYTELYPGTKFFWSVPITPVFGPQVTREEVHRYQHRLRYIKHYLRDHSYVVFDLAISFRTGEMRTVTSSRRRGDGIHPDHAVVKRIFREFRSLLNSRGVLRRLYSEGRSVRDVTRQFTQLST